MFSGSAPRLQHDPLDYTSVRPPAVELCLPALPLSAAASHEGFSPAFYLQTCPVVFYDSCFPSQSRVGGWGATGVSTWRWEVQSLVCQEEKFILLTIVSDFHFPQLARDAIFSSA